MNLSKMKMKTKLIVNTIVLIAFMAHLPQQHQELDRRP